MKTTNHTQLLQAICDLGDDFGSKKNLFSPDFYNEVQNCFSELEHIVAREIFSLTESLSSRQITTPAPTLQRQEPMPTVTSEDHYPEDIKEQESIEDVDISSEFTDVIEDTFVNPETETLPTFASAFTPVPEAQNTSEFISENEISSIKLEQFVPHEVASSEEVPTLATPISQPAQNEPVQLKEIVTKTGETEWRIPKNTIICQTHDILVKRGDIQAKIQFSVSPLTKVHNGTVPILVNAEYTVFDMKQNSTAKTEGSDVLLLMEVDLFTFLIKGTFNNGVFDASIMSAERSIEAGDIIETLNVQSNGGTEPAPCIELQKESKLWISFNKSFFGISHSEEWIDELNDNHEVMIPVTSNGTENYEELRLTQTDSEWIVKL